MLLIILTNVSKKIQFFQFNCNFNSKVLYYLLNIIYKIQINSIRIYYSVKVIK